MLASIQLKPGALELEVHREIVAADSIAVAAQVSAAISLKRIADALEKMSDETQTQYRWNALGDVIYSAIVRGK